MAEGWEVGIIAKWAEIWYAKVSEGNVYQTCLILREDILEKVETMLVHHEIETLSNKEPPSDRTADYTFARLYYLGELTASEDGTMEEM